MNSRNILTKFVSFFLVLSLSVVSFAETVEKFEEPNFEYTEEEKAILSDTPSDKPTAPARRDYSFVVGSVVLAASIGLVVYVLRRGAASVNPAAGAGQAEGSVVDAVVNVVAPRRNPVRGARFQNTYGE